MKYGAGVFEGIRGYWSEARGEMILFRLSEHLSRVEYSLRVMRFDRVFTPEEMAKPTLEVMRRNAFTEHAHIRPVVYVDRHRPVGLDWPQRMRRGGCSQWHQGHR